MIGTSFHGVQVVLGVVSLIEDKGDVLDPIADQFVASYQLRGQAGKCRCVVLVAWVSSVQKWEVKVGRDQQGEADDAQCSPAFFILPPLGKGRTFIEGINEREEVGCIKKDSPKLDVELADHMGCNIAFDGFDLFPRNPIHIVPEPLAGELSGLDTQESPEDGLFEPLSDAGFTAGSHAPVNGCRHQVCPYGWPMTNLGNMAIDVFLETEAQSYVIQGDDSPEIGNDGSLGLRDWESGGSPCHRGDEIFWSPEILLPNDFRLAVHSPAFAGIVVGLSADDLLRDAYHDAGHT